MIAKTRPFLRKVQVPIYRSVVGICLGDSIQSAHAEITKRAWVVVKEPRENIAARLCYDLNGRFIMCFEWSGLDHRIVAHEVFHATLHILQYHGLICDPQNHEAHAYVNGWLSEWVYRMLATARAKVKM